MSKVEKGLMPLFKWMGGKSRYLNKKGEVIIPTQKEKVKKFYDLFCGGGSVSIWAYEKFPNCEIHMSDTNVFIMGLYQAIKDKPKEVLEEYQKLTDEYLVFETTAKLTEKFGDNFVKKESDRYKYYYSKRDVLLRLYNESPESLGPDFYATQMFLMKTSFGGAWQTTEKYKPVFATPCGFLNETSSTLDMSSRVMEFSRFLNSGRVFLYNLPYSEMVIDKSEGSYVFFDPPYLDTIQKYSDKLGVDATKSMCSFMEDLNRKDVKVVMTNTQSPIWSEYLPNFHNLEDEVSFTGGAKAKTVTEVTLMNF